MKFKLYRPIRGKILECRIKQGADRWWISFVCDLGDAPAKIPACSAVGVDLGLHSFVVLSDGTAIENPRFFRAGEEILARRQRSLATKQRGSQSRERARRLVGRAHGHVRNQRLDFSRKLAAALVAKYDLIAHEDLQIVRMVRAMNLGKSINDAAWGTFLHALSCKAESAGKTVVAVDPRGTSQRCSGCGEVVRKDLSVRTHACPKCGLVLDRDHNAALNVLALGASVAGITEVQQEQHLTASSCGGPR